MERYTAQPRERFVHLRCFPAFTNFRIYTDANSMVKDFNYFDNLNRSFQYVVLGYAVSQKYPPSGPYMQGSVAEGCLHDWYGAKWRLR